MNRYDLTATIEAMKQVNEEIAASEEQNSQNEFNFFYLFVAMVVCWIGYVVYTFIQFIIKKLKQVSSGKKQKTDSQTSTTLRHVPEVEKYYEDSDDPENPLYANPKLWDSSEGKMRHFNELTRVKKINLFSQVPEDVKRKWYDRGIRVL